MTNHIHSLIITNYSNLIKCQIKFRLDENELNEMYREGERAQADTDYNERKIPCEFNLSCDQCDHEIEFLMYICLSCRCLAVCERCFQAARNFSRNSIEHNIDNDNNQDTIRSR